MNCAVIPSMARKLSASEEYTLIMDRVRGLKAATYALVRRKEMLIDLQTVSLLSFPSIPSFLERVKAAQGLSLKYMYSVLTFEPMHKLPLGILKLFLKSDL